MKIIEYKQQNDAVAKVRDATRQLVKKDEDTFVKLIVEELDNYKLKLACTNNGNKYFVEPEENGLFLLPKMQGKVTLFAYALNDNNEVYRGWVLESINIVSLEEELQVYYDILPDVTALTKTIESNKSKIAHLESTIEQLANVVEELRTTIYDPSI